VELVKWPPLGEVTKTKINVDASISKAQVFLGFVLFDHCGWRFQSVKLYPATKFEAVDVEACTMWEAISHVVQHNYLHVEIETDNLHVSKAMNDKLHPRSEKVVDNDFWRAISICCELIGNEDIKVRWIPRELNWVADYIVSHVQTQGDRVDDSFYVFSQSDKDAKAIIHWIDTSMIS
jgi:ribonuclease HI